MFNFDWDAFDVAAQAQVKMEGEGSQKHKENWDIIVQTYRTCRAGKGPIPIREIW